MSQAGIINVIDNNPSIPIYFDADTGTATAILNVIHINGSGGITTSASGNTIIIDGSGLSPSLTITGDTGGPLGPTLDNWNIIGGTTAAGTTPIQVNGSVSTFTINVQRSQAIASTNATNVGLSAFDSGDFTVDANGFVSLVSSLAFISAIKPDDGVDVFPNGSGVVEFDGLVVANATRAKPLFFSNGGFNILQAELQYSAAIAATDGTKAGIAAFNSSQFSVDATGFVSASGTGLGQTITGNSGGGRPPTAGNWNIVTANSTPTFVGSGSTLTLDFGLSNLLLGTSGPAITSASGNTSLGDVALNSLTSGIGNTCVGINSGVSITSSSRNVLMGNAAGQSLISGAGENTAIGNQALDSLVSGNGNIAIGKQAGSNYTSTEILNISIGNSGTTGESNVLRIGVQGGTGITTCFIAGIIGVTSSNEQLVTINSSTGQLGVRNVGISNVTTPGAYPYTTLASDYLILVDTTSARTIIPLGSPATGTTQVIKDNVGSAAANNITVTPSGKNIDGAASYVININYGSITIIYNGTQWNIV